ncbi:collagen-like triple helix repeat-containing protein [Chitinophaga vietnamensis]|uniref:collagen-like triple helix repeat-containing protein n=1 Tax=Chitinophaga vietnamensis TaxID=2593957 RepID=UPI001178C9E1|nr:collagen-like protein [Chitinophaga vietnamensis]
MKRILPFLPTLMILLFAACGKDGAQGIKGDPGPQGPAGPAGPKGDSTAVIYSSWISVIYNPDTAIINGKLDTLGWTGTMDAPKLSTSILNSGVVKVYVNIGTDAEPAITPLPYADEAGVLIRFVAYANAIALYANINASTFNNSSGNKVNQYRYVLMSGSAAARVASGVNWNDYTQVKQRFRLKD